MKIIVCGSGQVGRGIARFLSMEGNDVIVIDDHKENIRQIENDLDVTTIFGFPSHPTSLQAAGADDAEMIIAVTTSDEVNMVICQIAYSMFNMPIKIARVRHQNYLEAVWKELYQHSHLPIDHIISPEKEVANAIINRLHLPGAIDFIPFADGNVKAVEIRCEENCPILGKPLSVIQDENRDKIFNIVAVMRDNQLIIPNSNEVLLEKDEVFFVASSDEVQNVMEYFGHYEQEARRIVIVGGGNIGYYVAESLMNEEQNLNIKLIELNRERAEYVAAKLPDITVINGSALDQTILQETNVGNTETLIAVTNDDEVNMLCSLLAKSSGSERVFTLINKGKSYGHLTNSIGIDVAINPREMTVSGILRHTHKGNVHAVNSICGGVAEFIETALAEDSHLIGRKALSIDLPKDSMLACIIREGQAITLDEDTTLIAHDHLLIISRTERVQKLNKIFESSLEYF